MAFAQLWFFEGPQHRLAQGFRFIERLSLVSGVGARSQEIHVKGLHDVFSPLAIRDAPVGGDDTGDPRSQERARQAYHTLSLQLALA